MSCHDWLLIATNKEVFKSGDFSVEVPSSTPGRAQGGLGGVVEPRDKASRLCNCHIFIEQLSVKEALEPGEEVTKTSVVPAVSQLSKVSWMSYCSVADFFPCSC